MKQTKIYGICGLMILLLIIPIINVAAISSWPVQKGDELKYSLSYQNYDEDNSLTIDTSASISIIINEVGEQLTYNVSCAVNDEVGDWGDSFLKNHVEGVNLTSSSHFLAMLTYIIYEASTFADMENYWATLVNDTKEYFWSDPLTFTTYSTDEITNMKYSSSSDAYGYEITASWDDYKNLPAGNSLTKYKYSKDGVLLISEVSRHWVEGGGSDWVLENTDANIIPSFPLEILGICSIIGIVAIFIKKR